MLSPQSDRRPTRPRTPLLRLQEAGERPTERHATWTELFFDLVFVVAIAQLAAGLHDDVSIGGVLTFVGLFAPVWWTWTTYAYVADLFDADEGPFRLVLLGAMLLVGGMAATIPAAFDGHTSAFVIAYALLRADLVGIYCWAWRSDERLRRLTSVHAAGFSAGGVVWLASLLVPAPGRYAVWAVAIAIDLGTGLVAYLRDPEPPRHRSHMPERFGLFTLIVLGEAVIAVSTATAGSSWTFDSALTALLDFALLAELWWMYFARFDASVFDWALEGGIAARRRSFVFGYGHLPVLASLAAVGVGVKLSVEAALAGGAAGEAASVLCGGVVSTLVTLSVVQRAMPAGLPGRAVIARAAIAAAGLALAFAGRDISALALSAILAAMLGSVLVFEAVSSRAA
jgi:low temperature requirement protein LtrA